MTRAAKIIMITPFVIFAILLVTAIFIGKMIGVWVWVPICIIYWSSMAIVCFGIAGVGGIKNMFGASKGSMLWPILSILVALILLPVQFIPNIRVFSQLWVLPITIIVAMINSFVEEIYWRGMYGNFVNRIPKWGIIAYSSVLFSLMHIALAVNSIASRYPPLYISLIVLGVLWSISYNQTRSLRWPVITHIMVDTFTLCVPVFMNIYIPPGMG